MNAQTIYQENGYKDRQDYLNSLAEELGIDQSIVDAAADLLGESEDFDGLVTALEDYTDEFSYTQEFDDFSDADPGL